PSPGPQETTASEPILLSFTPPTTLTSPKKLCQSPFELGPMPPAEAAVEVEQVKVAAPSLTPKNSKNANTRTTVQNPSSTSVCWASSTRQTIRRTTAETHRTSNTLEKIRSLEPLSPRSW